METNMKGFTIIEVTMFMAISALLLMGAFLLTGNTLANTRFTDSMRGLESFLQRQYEEVVNGVNPRGLGDCAASTATPGSGAPGKSGCLLLGKLVLFAPNSSTVTSYTVVGSEGAAVSDNADIHTLLRSYDPRPVFSTGTTYSIPWGATFEAGRRRAANQTTDDSEYPNAVAILRSPKSSEIRTYYLQTSVSASYPTRLSLIIGSSSSDKRACYFVDTQDAIAGMRRGAIIYEEGAVGSAAARASMDRPTGVFTCS